MILRGPRWHPSRIDTSLPVYVLGGARTRGERVAVVDGATGETFSYRSLADAVERAAAGLAGRGVAKGDVVAICSPNRPELIVAVYAAAAAGAVVTTLNPLMTGHDIAQHLKLSEARWLVTTDELHAEKAGEVAVAAGLREVFLFDGGGGAATPFARLLEDGGRAPGPNAEPAAHDVAFLPFSSGTTGLSKGVVLSHANLVANLDQIRTVQAVREDDVVLAVLPFFHLYGFQVVMNLGLSEGATVVISPRFDPLTFVDLVERHRVTRAELVPPMILALLNQPDLDPSRMASLRLVTSAAAPLSAELARGFSERFDCRVKQVFGMTEAGVTHVTPENGRQDPGSVGPPAPGVECRVIDPETGIDVAAGEVGELMVRGSGVMRGYLNDPVATAATLDPEGWLRTGDLVSYDPDGWFRIVDRLKELIKYKGHQVPPALLEGVALTHPAVADVAVVPSPDDEAGEVPKAFVVRCGDISADDLLAFVAERVAPHQKLRRVEFTDQIPRSPSGKILRRVLVELERSRAATEATS